MLAPITLIVAASLFIAILVIGGAAFAATYLPILHIITAATLIIVLVCGLPMTIFQRTRPIGGTLFFAWSYLSGIDLWLSAILIVLSVWGLALVIIGILMCGVGVIAMSILASAWVLDWGLMGKLILHCAITFGARAAGVALMTKESA